MKNRVILTLVLVLLIFLLTFYSPNNNITSYAVKKSSNEFYLCKIKASNDYTECMQNRVFKTRYEAKICNRNFSEAIRLCIRERDAKRRINL